MLSTRFSNPTMYSPSSAAASCLPTASALASAGAGLGRFAGRCPARWFIYYISYIILILIPTVRIAPGPRPSIYRLGAWDAKGPFLGTETLARMLCVTPACILPETTSTRMREEREREERGALKLGAVRISFYPSCACGNLYRAEVGCRYVRSCTGRAEP